MTSKITVAAMVSGVVQGDAMDVASRTEDTAIAKDQFFAAAMYVFHITGFPQQPGVLLRQAAAPPGARLDVWRTDPADARYVPGPGAEGLALSTPGFSLVNSGNRTLHAPKRSWKVTLEHAGHGRNHLAGMTRVNLKSMYNDPSQMREALAWQLFRKKRACLRRGTRTQSFRSMQLTTACSPSSSK